MDIPDKIHEKNFIITTQMAALGKSSPLIDSYVSWMVGGFAAVFVFIIGNLESLSGKLPPTTIRITLYSFAAVAILGICEKLISVLVQAASAGAEIGRSSARLLLGNPDFEFIREEVERSFLPPLNIAVRDCSKIHS